MHSAPSFFLASGVWGAKLPVPGSVRTVVRGPFRLHREVLYSLLSVETLSYLLARMQQKWRFPSPGPRPLWLGGTHSRRRAAPRF